MLRWRIFGVTVLLMALHGALALPSSKDAHPDNVPFVNCPLYQIEFDRSLPYVIVEKNLSLAVFPTQSKVYMRILVDHTLYKASVEGTMVKLMKCDSKNRKNQSCDIMDEEATKNSDLLIPNQWNLIVISLANHTITVDINMKVKVMTMTMESSTEGVSVSVVAPSFLTSSPNYTVAVNVQCNGTYTPRTYPILTTINPQGTPEPIVETSTMTPALPQDHVGIIVGILVALLILIALAVTYSCYKKRSSIDVNHHTPLCEQQQQQQK